MDFSSLLGGASAASHIPKQDLMKIGFRDGMGWIATLPSSVFLVCLAGMTSSVLLACWDAVIKLQDLDFLRFSELEVQAMEAVVYSIPSSLRYGYLCMSPT